jgi:TonB family protein
VASAPSASRSPETAASADPIAQPLSQPAADVTVITTRDDFLLELGPALDGQAGVRPVDSLQAALAGLSGARRAQVLAIDARELPDVRAAVDAAHAALARVVVVVFAENPADKQLGSTLKGSKVFAVLPLPIDPRKTHAVLEGAIAEAVANKAAVRVTPAPPPPASLGPLQQSAPQPQQRLASRLPGKPLAVAAVAAAAVLAAGAYWMFMHGSAAPPGAAAPPAVAPPAAVTPAAERAAPGTTAGAAGADSAIVTGKVDELLEKARLAMHERRFSEPVADNALLYYRSAAAADPASAEARDGLLRVAEVLAGRFDEALNGGRFEEAALTLANFRAAAAGDARVAACEQRLFAAQISRALLEGNFDRATAYLRQAQQSRDVAPEQLGRWRADITRHQEEARVQHLVGLINERIREGKLIDAEDSAKVYLQQLVAVAPSNAATQRATHELNSAYLHKAREAGLAKNSAEAERWLGEARAAGLKPAELAAFQKDLSGARAKATQGESERTLQLARERLRDGRLTDPAQDSAAWYLSQVQTADPANAALSAASRELAKLLLERARTAVLAGKPGDADLAQAKRWGADPKDLAAVQQLQPPGAANASNLAALAASLKRLRAEPPDYPPSALAQHITGSVTLEYTVDARGETRDIHVVEATPPRVFDQAAISAVKHWRYAPMIVNGSAVEVPVKARMRFELPK